jgi:hypothetical protein
MLKFDQLTEDQLSQLPFNIGQIMAARAGMVGLRLDAFIAPECLQLLLQFSTYIAAIGLLGTDDEIREIQSFCNECVNRVEKNTLGAAIASVESDPLTGCVCQVCDQPFFLSDWESEVCPRCVSGDAC